MLTYMSISGLLSVHYTTDTEKIVYIKMLLKTAKEDDFVTTFRSRINKISVKKLFIKV